MSIAACIMHQTLAIFCTPGGVIPDVWFDLVRRRRGSKYHCTTMEEADSSQGALASAEEEEDPPQQCKCAGEVIPDPGEGAETVSEEKARRELERLAGAPGARAPQLLNCEELEYDSMYISPLDSSMNIFLAGLASVFLASLVTRLYKISEPPHIA